MIVFLHPAVSHVFQGPGFFGSNFFWVQGFQGTGFSGSMFFRIHVFQGPGPESGSRFQKQLFPRRNGLYCQQGINFFVEIRAHSFTVIVNFLWSHQIFNPQDEGQTFSYLFFLSLKKNFFLTSFRKWVTNTSEIQ